MSTCPSSIKSIRGVAACYGYSLTVPHRDSTSVAPRLAYRARGARKSKRNPKVKLLVVAVFIVQPRCTRWYTYEILRDPRFPWKNDAVPEFKMHPCSSVHRRGCVDSTAGGSSPRAARLRAQQGAAELAAARRAGARRRRSAASAAQVLSLRTRGPGTAPHAVHASASDQATFAHPIYGRRIPTVRRIATHSIAPAPVAGSEVMPRFC